MAKQPRGQDKFGQSCGRRIDHCWGRGNKRTFGRRPEHLMRGVSGGRRLRRAGNARVSVKGDDAEKLLGSVGRRGTKNPSHRIKLLSDTQVFLSVGKCKLSPVKTARERACPPAQLSLCHL